MDKKLYKFGMDWLNGVLPVSDVYGVFELLGKFSSKLRFERWQLTNSGKYNYSRRYCLDGNATIQLMYNPVSEEEIFTACQPDEWDEGMPKGTKKAGTHHNPYIFFSISGDGIRYLHSLGGDVSALNKLLFYFYRHSFRASRFDVYCDILDENNDLVPLILDSFTHFYKPEIGSSTICTNLQRKPGTVRFYQDFDAEGNLSTNVQLGHHGTRFGMFRCYNKYLEVSIGRLSQINSEVRKNQQKDNELELTFAKKLFSEYGVSDYWYRLEYEVHKENAAVCFNTLMECAESCNTPLCFEDIFFSVFDKMFSIVDYKTVSYGISRSNVNPIWAAFGEELSSSNEYFV